MSGILENIKTIRRLKKISQEGLAFDLNIDYTTYGKIERGQIALTLDRLELIARLFGMSVVDIITWPNPYHENGREAEQDKQMNTLHDNCRKELEQVLRENNILRAQLNDKEKIIDLLEKKSTGSKGGLKGSSEKK